jgi:hypothetical protein
VACGVRLVGVSGALIDGPDFLIVLIVTIARLKPPLFGQAGESRKVYNKGFECTSTGFEPIAAAWHEDRICPFTRPGDKT